MSKKGNTEHSSKLNINWYPGHMVKTKKEIIESLKLVDLTLEILDARIPISSQNPDIKEMIKDKKKIILLNKCDLASENENKKWISYFKSQGIVALPINSNTGSGVSDVTKEIKLSCKDELEKQASKGRINKTIRVLVVGIPNVGKSSFINRITKKTSATVGNRPGVTRQKQWIKIDSQIELLDTPGVLWPKFQDETVALNLAYTGTIKDEIFDREEVAFYLTKYLYKNYLSSFKERYKITEEELQLVDEDNIARLLDIIGKKRGAILSGGVINQEKVANIILDDFRSGKLGRITLETVKGSI